MHDNPNSELTFGTKHRVAWEVTLGALLTGTLFIERLLALLALPFLLAAVTAYSGRSTLILHCGGLIAVALTVLIAATVFDFMARPL